VSDLSEDRLVYDWAESDAAKPERPKVAMLDDETLRDGLQSPSVIDPPTDVKVKILHLMDSFGIETADVGLPGAGPRQQEAVETLCREIADSKLNIQANCAARTMKVDIQPIADVVQKTGVPIEACVFIGSSPIRQYAEEWDLEHILRLSREAVEFAVGEGLEVMYVTEDTVRAKPGDLRQLLSAGVEAGAKRLCLCDTVGAAVPRGVVNLVTWVKNLLEELGVADAVGIDWHGHRDRALDVANTLAAVEAGATRVHGTALGGATTTSPPCPSTWRPCHKRWASPSRSIRPSWDAMPSARPPACTLQPSSKPSAGDRPGWRTVSIQACRRAGSAARRRSRSDTCRALRTSSIS
jgi:2-isopropylmalate synthase